MYIFHVISKYVSDEAKDAETRMIPFAIFGLIAYVAFFFLNKYLFLPSGSYDSMLLRISIAITCLILALKNYWPMWLKPLLPYYWILTILYVFPFFITFVTMKNNISSAWILNELSIFILMMLLLNWIIYSFTLIAGIALAYFAYNITSSTPLTFAPGNLNPMDLINTLGISIIMGLIFSHKKNVIEHRKIGTLQSLAASIAHELRTPLLAIRMGAENICELSRRDSKQSHISNKDSYKRVELDEIASITKNIHEETSQANIFIDMLLNNVNQTTVDNKNFMKRDIGSIIKDSINRYPLTEKERKLITYEENQTKIFANTDSLLMTHVFFNLLKNAIFYIKASRKGEIIIWHETTKNQNIIHFKDTGSGIKKEDLPHIFDSFYSKTRHGTGIGLSYCRLIIRASGGEITCHSKHGEFTEFIISFPRGN
ncbi:MAG: HAMP domain-containing histidine kinase [Flavobacteriales bacterium]|nr:HAMP domain-containing histidine kinase [Flavobacteriales bacterium]